MANILLAYPNRIDAATLSGGSWSETLPQSNLQDRLLRKVARTADAKINSTLVQMDLGAEYAIGCVAAAAHNLSSAARVRVTGSASSSAWTDIITYRSAFDNAAWSRLECLVSATNKTAPDGSTNACEITVGGTAFLEHLRQTISSKTGTYVAAVWARQTSGTATNIRLDIGNAAASWQALSSTWTLYTQSQTVTAATTFDIAFQGTGKFELWQASMLAPFSHDSGWTNVWPSQTIPSDLREWDGVDFYLATASAQARAGAAAPVVYVPATAQTYRYWRLEFLDFSATQTDAFVQLGRVFIGEAFRPTYNYEPGVSTSRDDLTAIDRSVFGVEFVDPKPKPRTLRCRLGWVTANEARVNIDRMHRVGKSGEICIVPDSDDVTYGLRRNFLARLDSIGNVVEDRSGYSAEMAVRELI